MTGGNDPRAARREGESVLAGRARTNFRRTFKRSHPFQIDLPPVRPVLTRFRVQVGRCGDCQRWVQGRHPEQTSDALGAAGSQVGPEAKAFAAWLYYGLGLSFGKCAKVLARHGVEVTAGALCCAGCPDHEILSAVEVVLLAHCGRTWEVGAAGTVSVSRPGGRLGGLSSLGVVLV